MGGDHPSVTLGIDNGSTAVAPKHVHHGSLGCRPELYSPGNRLVCVLRTHPGPGTSNGSSILTTPSVERFFGQTGCGGTRSLPVVNFKAIPNVADVIRQLPSLSKWFPTIRTNRNRVARI
jgi:hypothetical protein